MSVPIPGRVGEALRRSTLVVRSGSNAMGSGVAMNHNLIVTNAHVVDAGELTVESWEGQTVRARVLRLHRERDLALLEADGLDASPAQLGDSDTIRPGMPVFAVGNPLGFSGAVSTGTIRGPMLGASYRWVGAHIVLAPGNSGGPLADMNGLVIGINTMVIGRGLALAVPSRSVDAFLKPTNARGTQLGMTVRLVQQGLLILEVVAGGPADQASLLPGDLLLRADGQALRSLEDLESLTPKAALLKVEFRRGGESRVRSVAVRLPSVRTAAAA
jgi:serine protease Do